MPHITNCSNKARRLVGLLFRRFHQYSSSSTLLKLYCSFIRPHLEHLESKDGLLLYSDLLFEARLPSLQSRRVHASLCHLFKMVRGLTEYPNAPLQNHVYMHNTCSSNRSTINVPVKISLVPKFLFSEHY